MNVAFLASHNNVYIYTSFCTKGLLGITLLIQSSCFSDAVVFLQNYQCFNPTETYHCSTYRCSNLPPTKKTWCSIKHRFKNHPGNHPSSTSSPTFTSFPIVQDILSIVRIGGLVKGWLDRGKPGDVAQVAFACLCVCLFACLFASFLLFDLFKVLYLFYFVCCLMMLFDILAVVAVQYFFLVEKMCVFNVSDGRGSRGYLPWSLQLFLTGFAMNVPLIKQH